MSTILKHQNGQSLTVFRDLGIIIILWRHSSWLVDSSIYVYGGFELDSPNIPTDMISKINLTKMFQTNEILLNKFMVSF